MFSYITRRLLIAVPVLLLVSFIVSGIIRLIPGDAAVARLAETGGFTQEQLTKVRQEMGLDKPFVVQYGQWVWGVMTGHPGKSLQTGRPVLTELGRTLPVTIELAILALLVSLAVGIPIGILSAIRQDGVLDYGGRVLSLAGLSLPEFWTATAVLLALAFWLHWSPPLTYTALWVDPRHNLAHLMLPASILGFRYGAATMRMVRSAVLEVQREDYVRTAWAKGLGERTVISRHILKNAFIPVITLVGGQFGFLLGGAVILELIFSLPGAGRLTLDSILRRDYTQVQVNVMFIAIITVLINLLVDVSYAWLDPRIRYGKSA